QQAPQQPAANDWQQAHPQPSAGDWHQAQPQQSAQDWNQQGWNQPQQQNWDQQAQQAWEQQQWQGQQAAPQGPGQFPAGGGYAGPWQGGSPVPVAKKPSPFDFGFKSGSLPGTAGTIFLVGTIGIGVWWLFEVIAALTYVFEFPLDFFFALIGEGGLALFAVMLLRAVLEVGVAAVGLLNKPDSTKADADDTTSV
ncbi:hypothetical protein ACFQ06_16020, partial [Tessaracoccus lubricantis]